MPDYWLDSNVFIEGRKGPYGFDIAPRFWSVIDEMVAVGRVSSSTLVYDELTDVQDDLAAWARARRTAGLFTQPNIPVQEAFREVIEYVAQRFPDNQARRRFLDRADPWVIAHAIAKGGAVVSLEGRDPDNSQKVKIPNVCGHFHVPCDNTYQMLRDLGVSWNT